MTNIFNIILPLFCEETLGGFSAAGDCDDDHKSEYYFIRELPHEMLRQFDIDIEVMVQNAIQLNCLLRC